MTFRTSRRADEDIANVYATDALHFGLAQAERYQNGLFDTFRMLAANPRMARERRALKPPMRRQPYGAHMIVYIEDWRGDPDRSRASWPAGLGERPVLELVLGPLRRTCGQSAAI